MQPISSKLLAQKVAIYIRVSTHWQVDKDSLQVQRRELIAYAQVVLGIDNFVVFEDPGYSAKNTDRPEYQHMMSRLRTGEFSHLLVWKIDRISRNLLDFANMYQELKSLGVSFVSKNEQFDTSSAIGEAMLKLIMVFAELERGITAERVTAVMLSRANEGKWNGGRVPFGYNYDKSTCTFSINEPEAKIVKFMYGVYEREQSLVTTARILNDNGFRHRSGKRWVPTTVGAILRSVFYIGKYRYNQYKDGGRMNPKSEDEWITIDNHHPAIIDEDLYDRIQFLLTRNRRSNVDISASYSKKNVHIFAGLVKCGECGSNMSATLDRVRADGWRPSIYGCATRRKSKFECNNKYVSDAMLGPFVFNYISNVLRAKGTVGSRSLVSSLESKLLRGPYFAKIESIEAEGLKQLFDLIASTDSILEYRPASVMSDAYNVSNDRVVLEDRKRKLETALNRLQSIYLYDEEQMAEKDFILERQKIISDIEEIDAQLNDLGSSSLENEAFMEKASYLIMANQLTKDRYVDYEKYIRKLAPSVPKAFIRSVVESIVVKDGKVISITFKNGITNKFIYKSE